MSGETITRYFTEAQLARYQPWFDNARRINDLRPKLEIASLQAVQTAEAITLKAPTTPPSKPHNNT